MGKKHKAEEHENLERWLVSYADFITLLFATFVVLYALAQADISAFSELQESMRKAFAAPSLIQGGESIMANDGQNMLDFKNGETPVPPMLEYLSAKYYQ